MAPVTARVTGSGAQKMPPVPQIFTTDTAQPTAGPSVPHNIHYWKEGVQENANLRVQWSNWMSDGKKKSCYKNVFVLLLSWHPDSDDLDVDPEVQCLKRVFKDVYNYQVESVLIDSRENSLPQTQANYAVASFVRRYDHDDALFIVYYAGHGSPGKLRGDLKLSGRRKQEKQRLSQQFSHISWVDVESSLKSTRADVLLIFDCCYASDLGRGVLNSRSFEYLAASNTSYTRSPGDASFTRALIWALEQLAPQAPGAATQASPLFTTPKLAEMIRNAPNFPQEQKPSLMSRDLDCYQHIILAPLPRDGDFEPTLMSESDIREELDDDEDDEGYKPVPQFLNLTFHFKETQDEAELKKLADHLKNFMRLENTRLHKVMWEAIWDGQKPPPRPRLRFREAVYEVMKKSPVSKRSSLSLPLDSVQSGMPSEQYGYQANEGTLLLSDRSPLTLRNEATIWGIWSGVKSFFRGFGKQRSAKPGQPRDSKRSSIGSKNSRSWINCLVEGFGKWFKRRSPRIQVAA